MASSNKAAKNIATNRRARFDYDFEDTFEAGLVLTGSEVKSLRAGQATLGDGYAFVRGGEVFLTGVNIAPYKYSVMGGHEPDRERKLLLHRHEIAKIAGRLAQQGSTLVPIRMYFKDGNAKVELGLGKGSRQYDKRQKIRAREEKREMDRASSHRGRID
jgi:SsrA-binding protein